MLAEEPLSAQKAQNVSLEVKESSSDLVAVVRQWELAVGKITETTVFRARGRRFDREVSLTASSAVAELYAESACRNKWMADRAVFLPEEERVAGSSPQTTAGLRFIEAYDPDKQVGFGIKPVSGIERQGRWVFGDSERGDDEHPLHRSRNYAGISVYSPVLSYEPVPAEYTLRYTGYMSAADDRPITIEVPKLELRKAWPKKMIARPDEGNTLDVIVRNNTQQRRQGSLKVILQHGLDVERTLVASTIELPPGDTVLQYEIDTSDIRYGVAVVTTLDETTDRTAMSVGGTKQITAYFTVWPRYYRVSPLMEIINPGGARGVLAMHVPGMRRGYVGVTEVYTWPPDPLYDMTPKTDWFVPGGNSLTSYMVAWSREYLKDFIATGHENGIGTVSWAQAHTTIASALAHPEVVQYNDKGQWHADFYRIYHNCEELTQGALSGSVETSDPSFQYSDPKVAKLWGQEMGASCRMFGWDGVRFDGPAPRFSGAVPVDPLKWKEGGTRFFDFEGRPICVPMGEDPDEYSLSNMSSWVEGARSGNPRFELGMNIGHGLTEDEHGSTDNVTRVSEWRKCLEYVGENEGMLLHEGALNIVRAEWNKWDSWTEKLMGTYRVAQKMGMVCTVGHIRWLPPIPDRTRSYVAFASGYRMAYTGSMPHSYGSGERFNAAEFAVRFGEFVFGADHEALTKDQEQLQVHGSDRLLWNQFVRKRQLANGQTEWLVHIVNLPASDIIAQNAERPPLRTGTAVSVQCEGKVTGAWTLRPAPPRAIRQEWRREGEKVVVDIDDIDAFVTVVVREEKP